MAPVLIASFSLESEALVGRENAPWSGSQGLGDGLANR
jgi:hypothetical protein